MINPDVGDYVISPTKIWEIVHIGKLGVITIYTIKLVDNPADILTMEAVINDTQSMSISRLRHLGELVKKEDAPKAIEVLFKNS